MDEALTTLRQIAALKEQLTRLEVKIDYIGLKTLGTQYATDWDKASFHNSMGLR